MNAIMLEANKACMPWSPNPHMLSGTTIPALEFSNGWNLLAVLFHHRVRSMIFCSPRGIHAEIMLALPHPVKSEHLDGQCCE